MLDAGLALLDSVADDTRLAGHHRVNAVRAHLLTDTGRHAEAAEQFRTAAQRTLSTPERQYLLQHAAHAETQSQASSP